MKDVKIKKGTTALLEFLKAIIPLIIEIIKNMNK